MKSRARLNPGQNGTKRFVDKYGDALVCIRYRHDVNSRAHQERGAHCRIDVETKIYADTLAEPIIRRLAIDYKDKTVETSYKSLLEKREEQE